MNRLMSTERVALRMIRTTAGGALCAAWLGGLASAQLLIPGSASGDAPNIFPSDMAVLEAGEIRKDLPCTVTPQKPELGFDLRLHTGYEVTIPLREFAGSDN